MEVSLPFFVISSTENNWLILEKFDDTSYDLMNSGIVSS